MDIQSLIISGVVIAASGGLVISLRKIPKLLGNKIKQRLLYSVRIYQYDELFDCFEKWLSHNHQKSYRDVEASIKTADAPRPTTLAEREFKPSIIYKQEDNTFVFNYKGKKLIISKNKEKIDKADIMRNLYFRTYHISGIKAKKQVNELLQEALDFSLSDVEKNTVKVFSSTAFGDWYAPRIIKIKPLDKAILPAQLKSNIINDLNSFTKSEDWYLEASIPYKRGYCFYGPPGTGKTTLALALANFTKRSVYCLNLNAMEDDSRLPYAFSNIGDYAILLIEDIDKVFSGRENINDKSKITFSSLLNCLDGAFYKHGLITIITTNHIEKLDEALIRSGRIDFKVEVPKPSDVEISEYLTSFYEKPMTILGKFDKKMSDIQEICLVNRFNPEKAKEEIMLAALKNGKLKQYELELNNNNNGHTLELVTTSN